MTLGLLVLSMSIIMILAYVLYAIYVREGVIDIIMQVILMSIVLLVTLVFVRLVGVVKYNYGISVNTGNKILDTTYAMGLGSYLGLAITLLLVLASIVIEGIEIASLRKKIRECIVHR